MLSAFAFIHPLQFKYSHCHQDMNSTFASIVETFEPKFREPRYSEVRCNPYCRHSTPGQRFAPTFEQLHAVPSIAA